MVRLLKRQSSHRGISGYGLKDYSTCTGICEGHLNSQGSLEIWEACIWTQQGQQTKSTLFRSHFTERVIVGAGPSPKGSRQCAQRRRGGSQWKSGGRPESRLAIHPELGDFMNPIPRGSGNLVPAFWKFAYEEDIAQREIQNCAGWTRKVRGEYATCFLPGLFCFAFLLVLTVQAPDWLKCCQCN